MFHAALLRCLLLLTAVLLLPSHAFWWAPPTTAPTTRSDCSSESPLAVKEIPLTYFRTYTYQPIAGHPFAAFPYYHHPASALQSPLLAGPARYEHGTYMHGSAYPMSVALPQQQQPQQQSMLPQIYQLPQSPVLHAKPLSSPTTTTSTTSTEAPTTTSTTTTTTTTTTTPPPPPSSTPASSSTSTTTSASATQATEVYALPQQQQPAQHQPQPQPYPYPYPTYNRRAYMGYNQHTYRAAYPYPDYTIYKTAPVTRFNSHGGQIQFVPCMCPVSVGAAGAVRNSLTPEGRTTSDDEEDLVVLARADDLNLPVELDVDTVRTQPETVDADKFKTEAEVPVKTGEERDISDNLLQKATETVNGQLSTNNRDDQLRDATEQASNGKPI